MRPRALFYRGSLAAGMLLALLPPALSQMRGPTSVAPVAEKLIDAVVNISTSQTMKGPEGVPLPRVPKGAPFEEVRESARKTTLSMAEDVAEKLALGRTNLEELIRALPHSSLRQLQLEKR